MAIKTHANLHPMQFLTPAEKDSLEVPVNDYHKTLDLDRIHVERLTGLRRNRLEHRIYLFLQANDQGYTLMHPYPTGPRSWMRESEVKLQDNNPENCPTHV